MPGVVEEQTIGETHVPHEFPQESELQFDPAQPLGQKQVPGTPGVEEVQDVKVG